MDATHGITGTQYHEHTQPIVYAWMRGGEYLYIGCGMLGIGRIFDKHHCAIKRDKVRTSDIIVWKFYENAYAAQDAEKKYIRKYKPKYNRTHVGRRKKNM